MGVKLIRIGLEENSELREGLKYSERREEFFAKIRSTISKLGYRHILIRHYAEEMVIDIVVSDLKESETPRMIMLDIAKPDDPEVERILEAINPLLIEFVAYRWGEMIGMSFLIQQLQDKILPWQARRDAARKLSCCPEENVAAALIEAVKEDPNGNVREMAVYALGCIINYPAFSCKVRKMKEIEDVVLEAMFSDKSQKVKQTASRFFDVYHPKNDVLRAI